MLFGIININLSRKDDLTMEKFKLNTSAELVHINTRKEGNEDNKEIALDLKFKARISADVANFFGEGLMEFMFLADGAPRFKRMEQIGFEHELVSYCLVLNERTYYGVTVNKFKLTPVNGSLIDLTFSISFKPTSQAVATLAEFLDEMIAIELTPQNTELNFEGDAISPQEKLIDGLSELAPGSGDFDPLYNEAILIVQKSQRASISNVQRELRIGYNRAARLIESMEVAGVVSSICVKAPELYIPEIESYHPFKGTGRNTKQKRNPNRWR